MVLARHQARVELSEALLATTDQAYAAAARNAASAREATDTLAAARRGEFVADRWAPDLRMTSGQGFQVGVDMAVTGMEADLSATARPAALPAGPGGQRRTRRPGRSPAPVLSRELTGPAWS